MEQFIPGRLAALAWDSNTGIREDLFVRGPNDSLVHWWFIDFGDSGVEDLGGKLRGDPVAVSRRPDRLDIFARGWGSELLHWWWDAGEQRVKGPEPPREGWRVAYDPTAACPDAARAFVYTQGVDNYLRIIGTIEDGWFIDNTSIEAAGPVCAVPYGEDADIFSRGHDGNMVATGEFHLGEGRGTFRPGGVVAGRPVARRWGQDRVDVFALGATSAINHWGWSATESIGTHRGVWFTDEEIISGGYRGDLLVFGDQIQMDLLAVTTAGVLENWHWDGTGAFIPYNHWERTAVIDSAIHSPISSAVGPNGLPFAAYAWSRHGEDLSLLRWSNGQLHSDQPEWPDTNPLPDPVFIDLRPATHVVRRSDDMVILGVDLDEGRLGLTFAPQHVGEEVQHGAAEEPLHPPVSEGGIPTWRSCLSGPSRLVFEVEDGFALSAKGLLAAAAEVVIEDTGNRSAVELPSRLFSYLTGAASAEHPTEPWVSGDVVSLWRTRLVGELGLAPVQYGEEDDEFELPLGFAARGEIVAQGTPAAVERLELSALGGWLIAHGRWPSFDWDHETVLGRDWKVKTVSRGIIYPTGHRAEYVEQTTRDSEDPIAVLRKTGYLVVTEPVRGHPADEKLARVFPFESVEIVETVLDNVDGPEVPDRPGSWFYHDRPKRNPGPLEAALEDATNELRNIGPIPGDWTGNPPIVEDLADGGGDDLAAAQADVANRILSLIEQIDALNDQIAAVTSAANAEPVPWYFTPCRDGVPIRIPVRCNGFLGPISFELPVVFVMDSDFPQTDVMTAFDSLTDAQIASKLAKAFADAGGGEVPLPSERVDLLHSTVPQEIDIQVVRKLNVVGVRDGRGFRPRLGPPQQPDDAGAEPLDVESWAVEVDLVEMRNLLPDKPEAHTTQLSFSKSFEDSGDASRIPLSVAGTAVPIDFRGATERAGGLVAPVIEATGLARDAGLVNAAGLESLDPCKMISPDATLIGVPLHSLLDGVTDAPKITSDLGPDGVTTVTMAWKITLSPTEVLQKVNQDTNPELDLDVVTGRTSKVTCTLTNFALALPPKVPLLKLSFAELKFLQEADQPPRISISEPKAEFQGALDLLQKLQEKISVGDSLPELRASDREIVARYSLPVPEISTGAFVIRNAEFNIAVTVPFRGDPVSVALGFASREKPFLLSVLMFGGGGYMALEFRGGSLSRMEIMLEFGAAVAVKFLIARGEAHVLGGVRFELIGEEVRLTGFLRIGGSLEVLGIVSVSVELVLELGYQTTGNRLVGRATLVIEIDLTLWSDKVELDSGEWVISGDQTPSALPAHAAATRPRPDAHLIKAARAFREAYR